MRSAEHHVPVLPAASGGNALLHLSKSMLTQDRNRGGRETEGPPAAVGLRGRELVRTLRQGVPDGDDARVKVNIRPAEG